MKSKKTSVAIIIMFVSLLLSACGVLPGQTAPTPTLIPVVTTDNQIVAEGNIVPKEETQLAFFTSGQIAEVLVTEGDEVTVGQIVARLGNREQLEAAIAGAESELVAANQARKSLDDNLALAQSDAAGKMALANKSLKDAQYALDNFTVPQNMKGLTPLEAIAAMKVILDNARDAFEPYKYWDSGNQTRKNRLEDLDSAQSDYNTAVRWLQLETNQHVAETNLDQTMKDYQDLLKGPDQDLVDAADARSKAAQANLAAANANLDNLELKATIAGTVVKNDIKVGDYVLAGSPVMLIADFSEMFAETDDLTEIDVVNISLGQVVEVVPDALPGLTIQGAVTKISRQSIEKRGDITYTTRVRLKNPDPRLRWGMTVSITFLKP